MNILSKEIQDDRKEVLSNVTMSQIDKIYKKMALLDALISPINNYQSEILKQILYQFEPIFDCVIPSRSIFKLDEPSYRAGNTIIHVAKSVMEWDICKDLIDNGADFTVKDNNGSPLLTLEPAAYESRRCFQLKLGHTTSDDTGLIEIVLSAHIEHKNTTNPSDKNGISHFHFACMYNKLELIELFLKSGVPINEIVKADSPVYPGFTPLHFSAKYCAVEAVELLLKYGANTHIKDSKGLNPLHVLIEDKLNTWGQISRRLRVKKDQDNCLRLEKFHDKIEKIMTLLLEQIIPTGFGLYDDTGLSSFHVICTMQNTSVVEEYLNNHQVDLEQAVLGNSALWPGYTALHFAAHFNAETVKLLVTRGANLAAKDAKGITPFDICFNGMTCVDIHSILTLDPTLRNTQFSDGKTMLSDFILAMRDNEIFSELMSSVDNINTFIPLDSPICAGQTPLHLSVICKEIPRNLNSEDTDYFFESITESLVYWTRTLWFVVHKADIYAQDAQGSTPIHLAFELRENQVAYQLLCHYEKHENFVDKRGLSFLHIACAIGSDNYLVKVIEKLLSIGSSVNEITKSSYIGSSSEKASYPIISKGSTPLHIAVIHENPLIVKLLVDHNADILAKDDDGFTPLERSFETSIFGEIEVPAREIQDNPVSNEKKQILEYLVPRMSDLLADTKPDRMMYCYSLLRIDILRKLLNADNESMMKILNSSGITRLHVACFTKNLLQVKEQLKAGIDVNARVDLTSALWPGFTALHISADVYYGLDYGITEQIQIATFLLANGADISALDPMDNTFLHKILQRYLDSSRGDVALNDYIDMLLGHITDFSVNLVNLRGLSYLHATCVRNNAAVIEKLLEHNADINQAVDYFDNAVGGYTALHFAAAYQSDKALEVLLKRGADVHREDVFKQNSLHAAFARDRERQPCASLLRSLISAGVLMSTRNVYGQRPLEKMMKGIVYSIEEVETFVEHGCPVNVWNPITEEGCLAIVLREDGTCPNIFQTILKASDIKSISINGRNAIHNIVSYEADWDWYDEYDAIEEIFIPSETYTAAIQTLVDLGLDIDLQDNHGYTPLHIAAKRRNITGIVGLLNNGANVNIFDGYGEPAFKYSLEFSKSEDLIGRLDRKIITVISNHLYRLKLIGFNVHAFVHEVWDEILEKILLNGRWWLECRCEFFKMKSRNIDIYSITMSDFWSDTGAVSSYPHMLPDKRNAINEFFKGKLDELKREFPNLIYLLLTQYKKAIARVHLIEPAETSFNCLVDFPMPPICSRIILRFLSNEDLKNMIKTMDA